MERHFCCVGVVVIHEGAEDFSAAGRGGETELAIKFLVLDIEDWEIDKKIFPQPRNVVETDDSVKKGPLICLVESGAIYIAEGGF